VNKGNIRSICARLSSKRSPRPANEGGQALPIVLGIMALGIMVVAPFLSHASTNLISAQNYQQMLYEQYSADAGVEEAIWRLAEEDLSSQIPKVNDRTSYTLTSGVNNISPVITVTRISSEKKEKKNGKERKKDTLSVFEIESRAGSTTITAGVLLEDGQVQIDSWQVEK
jgi:hypothetical protein